MVMFTDRDNRYVVLRPEHVSAVQDGGNQFTRVFLRGGQTVAVASTVEEIWQVLTRQVALNKQEQR